MKGAGEGIQDDRGIHGMAAAGDSAFVCRQRRVVLGDGCANLLGRDDGEEERNETASGDQRRHFEACRGIPPTGKVDEEQIDGEIDRRGKAMACPRGLPM